MRFCICVEVSSVKLRAVVPVDFINQRATKNPLRRAYNRDIAGIAQSLFWFSRPLGPQRGMLK